MTDVEIGNVDATFVFEPETITASPPAAADATAMGAGATADVDRIRAILQPIVMDLLSEELSQYSRIRG